MGHRLTPEQEVQQLRQATREAHEAMQGLADAIREANLLAPRLVADFEATHAREIKQLSNYFTQESNKASADLNAAIEQARTMIVNQIMAGEAVFDADTRTVAIRFGEGSFDSQVPLPFPSEKTWKETQ